MAAKKPTKKQDLLAEVVAWLELRGPRRIRAARAETTAIADLLRTGDWRAEVKELSKCK
jgi:hypothetical protein